MGKYHFAIDRGGTFTDIYARCPNGSVKLMKLLSVDPTKYKDAPTEGIRRILEEDGMSVPKDEKVPIKSIGSIRMGTTVATNALLERKGERIALVINQNFRDLLFIGNQARPNIFDLEIKCPAVLYEDVVEVEERLVLHKQGIPPRHHSPIARGITGDEVEIWTPLNESKLRAKLQKILDKGITSLAVALLHSYMYPEHEKAIGKIALEMGFKHVSLSSQVMPMVRIVPRGFTACADAYLTPCIKEYVDNFSSGFENDLKGVNVLFMQSDGGLTPKNMFFGSRAILSGPAGGVVGYALTTYKKHTDLPVIGFDMGGTSTDVSRYDGHYEHIFESTIAGVAIQAPQLDINTVAAGGGSMLFFRSGMFVVGPESASAHPGPVCYRKGGPLTVTDANLCLGRLLPKYFPSIFGPNEDQPLDKEGTKAAFEELTKEVNSFLRESPDTEEKELSIEEVALGFVRVANEAMCRPIRALTQGKGHDTSQHALACFGGAGGQHACAIARSLGMSTVFIHKYAGILSAYGMSLADVVYEVQEPCSLAYAPENFKALETHISTMKQKCREELKSQGFQEHQIEIEIYLHLRYDKTDCALMCLPSPSSKGTAYGDFASTFLQRYHQEFGFTLPDRAILVDDIRIRGIGKDHTGEDQELSNAPSSLPTPAMTSQCYFEEGWKPTRVFLLTDLLANHVITGPAIIIDKNCTILVEPDCEATICKNGDVKITIGSGRPKKLSKTLDTIQLSIFSHRFMSIAEQMGRVLQRTSISTNIKERLDFSCALFGPDGGLVSNAPHIPVHLGAMQETVQFQLKHLGENIHPGDVILSNHPIAGGSHLPDLTVITPVFFKSSSSPVFFVASRGHHADIGGITPGSMPSHSTSLYQEGATFISFKLVENGIFQEEKLIEALMDPAKYPGSSGTRNLKDNIADLQAQVAANQKGINLVTELINYYGLEIVQAYMKYIQTNAEVAVRDMLKKIGENYGETLSAVDYMDDGTPIKLNIKIDKEMGNAILDFSGTGLEVYGNCNAPRAVTLSAIIYCLRCIVGHDIPLNQGCMEPIKVIIPEGILLNPSPDAAVVGGNVLTSQRVVDVIFKAFRTCAASQGCMNNITFGDEEMGYYETVAGGAGAGPGWSGRSGVHSHMTNTRITDPEIVERRYPVLVQRFELRPNSGGKGKYSGGDGVIRELFFRKPLHLSILTERRVFAPYGMEGGKDGEKGRNILYFKKGRVVNLGAKTSISVQSGDILHVETPGGGGYGLPEEISPNPKSSTYLPYEPKGGSLHEYHLVQTSS